MMFVIILRYFYFKVAIQHFSYHVTGTPTGIFKALHPVYIKKNRIILQLLEPTNDVKQDMTSKTTKMNQTFCNILCVNLLYIYFVTKAVQVMIFTQWD